MPWTSRHRSLPQAVEMILGFLALICIGALGGVIVVIGLPLIVFYWLSSPLVVLLEEPARRRKAPAQRPKVVSP